MLSQNKEESLTLEEAQDLQVCRALRNIYTGALCTIVDRKVPTNEAESMIGDTLYEVRKVNESDYPSFIISAPALFNLYHYALNEEGRRYCIAVFNYEKDNDEKLTKNEEEFKMKKILAKDLEVGQILKVVENCIVSGIGLVAGEEVEVKKVYNDNLRVSLRIIGRKTPVLAGVGNPSLNKYFELVVPEENQEQLKIDLEEVALSDAAVATVTVTAEGATEEIGCGGACEHCTCGALAPAKDVAFDSDELKGIPVLTRGRRNNVPVNPVHYEGRARFSGLDKAFINDNATIVILKNGIKGIAKCDLEHDEFDEYVGFNLAYARAVLKSEKHAFKLFDKEANAMVEEIQIAYRERHDEHVKILNYVDSLITKLVNK